MAWIGGALIGGASLLSGAMSSDAASNATNAQTQASDQSIAEQRRQFDLTRSDNAPFLRTGTAANQRLAALLGLNTSTNPIPQGKFDANAYMQANPQLVSGFANDSHYSGLPLDQAAYEHYRDHGITEGRDVSNQPSNTAGDLTSAPLLRKFSTSDLNADPVYNSGLQFGLDRGTEAINSRSVANGMYDSGATLKALTQFGNDYGSTKANDSYNRYTNDQNNTYAKLTGTSSTGQVASGSNASAGTSMANNVSGSFDAAGNARAAGIVGGSNAWGSGITGAASGYNNYNNNQQLMALLRGTGGGGYQTNSSLASQYNF